PGIGSAPTRAGLLAAEGAHEGSPSMMGCTLSSLVGSSSQSENSDAWRNTRTVICGCWGKQVERTVLQEAEHRRKMAWENPFSLHNSYTEHICRRIILIQSIDTDRRARLRKSVPNGRQGMSHRDIDSDWTSETDRASVGLCPMLQNGQHNRSPKTK